MVTSGIVDLHVYTERKGEGERERREEKRGMERERERGFLGGGGQMIKLPAVFDSCSIVIMCQCGPDHPYFLANTHTWHK